MIPFETNFKFIKFLIKFIFQQVPPRCFPQKDGWPCGAGCILRLELSKPEYDFESLLALGLRSRRGRVRVTSILRLLSHFRAHYYPHASRHPHVRLCAAWVYAWKERGGLLPTYPFEIPTGPIHVWYGGHVLEIQTWRS